MRDARPVAHGARPPGQAAGVASEPQARPGLRGTGQEPRARSSSLPPSSPGAAPGAAAEPAGRPHADL